MTINPRRRRSRRGRMPAALARYWAARRGNPHRRRSSRRHHRRNPGAALPSRMLRVFQAGTVTDALWGALGFIGAKSVPAMLPIPVQLKVGPMRYVTGAVTAWGLGQVATKVAGRRVGNMIWMGGIISIAADVVSDVLLPMLPMGAPAPAASGVSSRLGVQPFMGLGARLPYGVEDSSSAWAGV